MALNILLLVGSVLLAIVEVFLLVLAGYVLARMDILNKQTRKQVNRLNITIFTPALLFTKVAFSLTGPEFIQLWIIPVLFTIVTIVSAGIAYLLGLFAGLKRSHRNFAIACAMFMNSNSIPIALIQSLTRTLDKLKWNSTDTPGSMLGRALTYMVLYSTLGNILRWSYGVKLLEKADDTPEVDEKKITDPESQAPPASGLTTAVHSRSPSDSTTTGCKNKTDAPITSDIGDNSSQSRFYFSEEAERSDNSLTENQPNQTLSPQDGLHPLSTVTSCATLAPATIEATFDTQKKADMTMDQHLTPPQGRLGPLKRFWKGFLDFMTPPLWASLASIVVAVSPPIQDAIANHMSPVRNALESASDCSIPLTMVVLGAYFYTPPKGTEERPLKERIIALFKRSSPNSSQVEVRQASTPSNEDDISPVHPHENRTFLVAILSRMILTPMIVLPIMLAFVKYDVPRVFSDPVFVVSNVLLASAPVALTLAQMSSKSGAGDVFERMLSKTIFWSYCVATTPVTIICVVLGVLIVDF